jgi:hypothetical protein
MTMHLRWEFELPYGYQMEKGGQTQSLGGPRGAQFQLIPEQNGQTIVIRGELRLPMKNFRQEEHKALVDFLDESLKALGTEIVMKRR